MNQAISPISTTFFIAICFLLLPTTAFSAVTANGSISWLLMVITMAGGLAFFLHGMEVVSTGLKQIAGDKMRSILASFTKNTFIGILAGAFVTTIIQSSSATMVMLISFVQSQLMAFGQSLGIILGANIGATVTAQLVAFKVTDAALAMVAVGFALHMLGRTQKLKSTGTIILGFGMLFFGMKLMTDATAPLRSLPEFIHLMTNLEQPLLGLLVGLLFTAVIQSSGASIGLVIVLAQQNLITLEAGIPIILGANIGTCVTAVLAAIGMSREAKRVALAYVIIEVVGVAAFLLVIPQFVQVVQQLAAYSGSGVARQIANAHTIFNVTLAILFFPAIGMITRLCMKMLPDEKVDRGIVPVTWHLDKSLLSTPSLALELARAEIARMAKITYRMHSAAIYPFVSGKPRQDAFYPHLSLLEGINMREQKIDYLEYQTRQYLLQISRNQLTEKQTREIAALMTLLDALEGIGDTIIHRIVPIIMKKEQLNADFSRAGKRELVIYHRNIGKQLRTLQDAMTTLAYPLAEKVKAKRYEYGEMDAAFRKLHLKRLVNLQDDSITTHAIHIELMDALKIINLYAAEIADELLGSGVLEQDEDRLTTQSEQKFS